MSLHKGSQGPANGGNLRFLFTAIFFLFVVFYLAFLGNGTLWDNSETIYSQILKETLRSDDFLTLKYMGKPWFVHPPLFFWCTIFFVKLFGLTEFALRFTSSLFGLATIWLTYKFGKLLYNRRIGLIAAGIFGTTIVNYVLSKLVGMDTILNFFILLAIYCFYYAYKKDDKKYYLYFWIACSFATLAKGPIGLALPLMIIFVYTVWTRDFYTWKDILYKGLGPLVYLCIASPWYIHELLIFKQTFFNTVFLKYNVNRYLGVVENQAGPVYYYFPVLILGFFPWAIFIPGAYTHLWRRKKEKDAKFLLATTLFVFLFFSFAQTKLPNYIFTMFPLLAIGMAAFLRELLTDEQIMKKWETYLAFVLILLQAAFFAYGIYLYGNTEYPAIYHNALLTIKSLLVLLVSLSLFSAITFLLRRKLGVYTIVVLFLGTMLSLELMVLPQLESFKFGVLAGKLIKHETSPKDKIYTIGDIPPSLIYYADRQSVPVAKENLQSFLDNKKQKYLVVVDDTYDQFKQQLPKNLKVIHDYDLKRIMVLVKR